MFPELRVRKVIMKPIKGRVGMKMNFRFDVNRLLVTDFEACFRFYHEIMGFEYQPTLHVHYGEKVLTVRDGLPKFKDFPKDFGGSGDMLPE